MRLFFITALLVMSTHSLVLAGDLPSSSEKIIQQARLECSGLDNGEFHATEKAVALYDFTGDGNPEELVDGAQFSCSTAATMWGGSGGSFLWIVVPDKTYEFLAHRWWVVDVDGQNVLLLAVHSSQCSDDIGPCYRALVWQDGFRTTRVGIE